ncbi:MAG: CBS domain-containing protein, partial [Steroidobacteraceae bacterium]
MKVRQLCSPAVVSAPESASVGEIAQLMRDRHVGAVVILGTRADRSLPVGIITDRDIVRAQLEHAVDLAGLAALVIMTSDPLVLREDTEFNDALDRMA